MTVTGPCNAPDVVDVVALGESMVTFLPTRPGRLADVPSFERAIGGAESNVACALAAAGYRTRWVSRVGADGFGDHLVEAIGRYGVEVVSVRRDPSRPTGVYFRTAGDRGTDAHEVAYYRAGSAASAMSVADVDLDAVRSGRVLHLSGITAALSEGCLELLRELTAPYEGRPLVSFDVNYRPGLWGDDDGPRVLLELARRADVVFVGDDEAEQAWGISGGPEAVRAALPEPGVLVVKQGGAGATAFVSAAGLVAPTRWSRQCHSPAPLGLSDAPTPQDAAGRPAQPGDGGLALPADGGPAQPVGGRPALPVDGPAQSGDGGAVLPADGGPAQPGGGRPAQSADGGPAQPGDGGLVLPAEGGPTQPADGGLALPGDGGAVLPADGGPAQPVGGRPALPADGRPAQSADGGPAQPGDGGLVLPADRGPTQPGGSRPSPAAGSRAAGAAPVPQRGGTPSAPGCAAHPRSGVTPDAPQPTAFVPSPHVHIAAATGAGDAFAAGFLSATLRGLPVRERLRHGHLWAAATLTARGDLAAPPSRDIADRLVALDDAAWEKLRLGPGWTQAAERADEEGRTP